MAAPGGDISINSVAFLNALREGMRPPQFQPNPGMYQGLSSNPFNTGNVGTIAMQQSDFFGPFGILALQGLDSLMGGVGLVRPGYGGMPTPVFNTAMNLRSTGLSSFQMQMADMNGTAFGNAYNGLSAARQAVMARTFSSSNSNWANVYNTVNDSGKNFMDFMEGAASNPMLSPLLNAGINWATGYDIGAGANVGAQRSMDIAGRFGGRQGPFSNVLSRDFQDARAGLAALIGKQAYDQTWSSYAHKNKNVYGASETLVASIISDALQTGGLDTEAMMGGLRGTQYEGMSENEIVKAAALSRGRLSNLTAERERLSSDLSRRNENSPEARRLKERIGELDRQIKEVSRDADTLGDAIQRGTEPLVEAVTKTVDTLKTFYRDETQSTMALNRLTGGQGMRDRRLAESVNRQMAEIRDTAILAGMSPEIAARHVEQLQSQLMAHGSGIGAGNALSGQLAMGFGQMSLSTIRGLSGDPTAQQHAMAAFGEFAASFDQSEGKKFSIMLETALQTGKIDRKTYERLRAAGLSGDYMEFERAKRELFVRTNGSVAAGKMVFENDQAIADMSNNLDSEALERSREFATGAVMSEMGRLGVRAERTEARRNAEDRLLAGGYSAMEVRGAEDKATTSAIRSFLSSPEGNKDLLEAYEAKVRSYRAKGMSQEASERLANKWVNENFVKKGNVLTREQKDRLEGNMAAAQQDALNGLETNGLTEGDLAGITGDKGVASFLKDIGAVGSDGKLSAQAFGQSSADVYQAMMREADALGMDSSEVAKEYEQFKADLHSGDPNRRRRALATFRARMSRVKGASGRMILRGALKHEGEYRNTDVLQDEKLSGLTEEERAEYNAEGTSAERREELEAEARKRDDVFRSLSKNAEFAKILKGFKTDDARWTWGKLQHQLSTEFKNVGDLSADEKKRYDELSGKDESQLTDEEKSELARLKSDPRAVKYSLEKQRDEAQRKGIEQQTGAVDEVIGALTSEEGLAKLAEKAKASGVALEDFYDTIKNIVEKLGGLFGVSTSNESEKDPLEGEAGASASGKTEGTGAARAEGSSGPSGSSGSSGKDGNQKGGEIARLTLSIDRLAEEERALVAKLDVLVSQNENSTSTWMKSTSTG